ncbi:MAG: hypothetical protein JWR03_399 [Cohnella sp.]|nr:hypothetical protein [Cohnella sp.]
MDEALHLSPGAQYLQEFTSQSTSLAIWVFTSYSLGWANATVLYTFPIKPANPCVSGKVGFVMIRDESEPRECGTIGKAIINGQN